MKRLFLCLLAPASFLNLSANEIGSLPKVVSVDLADYSASHFSNDEWFMPYYLKHFSEIANAVMEDGENRGFIDISVWRPENVNEPFNARIMESIFSLAWFYTHEREWNPYFGDEALRLRLEAALDFWSKLPREDGVFSEYSYDRYTLAPTAFATKFVGRALLLLKGDPDLDKAVYQRALLTLRGALRVCFEDEALWEHGRNYTNQYANLWGGALMYLEIKDDPEIRDLFEMRLKQSISDFQSPLGFFYEAGGPDWQYNLFTHHSDLLMAWHYGKGSSVEQIILEKTKRWYDWFSLNAVLEPGAKLFYLNRAIESRTRLAVFENSEEKDPASQVWTPQSEYVLLARAFEMSEEELADSRATKHAEMALKYPEVAPLETGKFWAYSPYAFVHEGLSRWHPTELQKQEAIGQLPYLALERFVKVLSDSRSRTQYAYIKTPRYYAIFNSGKIVTEHQRFGLGLVWNPLMGTVLQSQSRSDRAAFGTRKNGQTQVFEASDLFVEYSSLGELISAENYTQNLDADSVSIYYSLGGEGRKSLALDGEGIHVEVECEGSFEEVVPLLLAPGDELKVDGNLVVLQSERGRFELRFSGAISIVSEEVETDLEIKRCVVLEVTAKDSLQYDLSFVD